MIPHQKPWKNEKFRLCHKENTKYISYQMLKDMALVADDYCELEAYCIANFDISIQMVSVMLKKLIKLGKIPKRNFEWRSL